MGVLGNGLVEGLALLPALGLVVKASMMHIDKLIGWGLDKQKERESPGESERVKWERAGCEGFNDAHR